MRVAHRLRPGEPDDFAIDKADALVAFWKDLTRLLFTVVPAVVCIGIVVGGIVIMNIMLVGVVERTREIGVRLALGARKRDIRRQFLLEAALLSTAGGAAGVVLGAAAAAVARGALGFPTRVTPLILVGGIGLSTAVGLAAGYLPARSASNLLVVDALRDET